MPAAPFKRWAFNVLAAVSLAVCVAALVLWPWSCWSYAPHDGYRWSEVRDEQRGMSFDREAGERSVTVAAGGVRYWSAYSETVQPVGRPGTHYESGWRLSGGRYPLSPTGLPGARVDLAGGGFQLLVYDYDGPRSTAKSHRELSVTLPLWFVAAVAAVPPALWLRAQRRRRLRRAAGLCPKCGYDLRATPGRCSECGEGNPAAPAS